MPLHLEKPSVLGQLLQCSYHAISSTERPSANERRSNTRPYSLQKLHLATKHLRAHYVYQVLWPLFPLRQPKQIYLLHKRKRLDNPALISDDIFIMDPAS